MSSPDQNPAVSSGTISPRPASRRICIVAQNAYGALAGGTSGHVGGAEHQTTVLARWLAGRGHQVSLLTWDEGQPDGAVIDGVRVVTMCAPDRGLPGLRFVHPRFTSLLGALRRAEAEVYYHNSAEYVTGLVAVWCRLHRRRFVYSVASDVACDIRLPVMPKRYERVLYRCGLRKAHRIIVQTDTQRRLLHDGFGLDSVALPMPCPGPTAEEHARTPAPAPNTVAWVGRAAAMKRLEWMLEVAGRMPAVTFHLAVANTAGNAYAERLETRARTLANVVWHGPVPRAAMAGFYRNAACLCCTSSYEGFPNTFLEAWSHGRPLVTTFDPDGLVARRGLGAVAGDVDGLVVALRDLLSSPSTWLAKSRAVRQYYEENHPPEVVLPRVERELLGPGA